MKTTSLLPTTLFASLVVFPGCSSPPCDGPSDVMRHLCSTQDIVPVAVHPCEDAPHAHLCWAEDLALHVSPELNEYGSDPTIVTWAGQNGAEFYQNRSKCASFLTGVLIQSEAVTAAQINGPDGKGPSAATYHDMITAGTLFSEVKTVQEIRSGDIIAIKYIEGVGDTPDSGGEAGVTGHVAIARGPAVERDPSEPIVNGTTQFEIEVVDSTRTAHGAEDLRETYGNGVGFGSMRLYVDGEQNIIGYTWSTCADSILRTPDKRHMRIGRLD